MHRKDKQQKRNMILVAFISIVMISSVFGIIFSGYNQDSTISIKYNNIKFVRETNQVIAKINGQKVIFDYFPPEVEYINVSTEVKNALVNRAEVDFTSHINDTFAEDIALAQYNLMIAYNNLNLYLRQGFTTNTTYNLPIITCEDSTPSVPVVYFMQSNETKISIRGSCVVAEARNSMDILRIKDRLLYSMIGVIG